MENLEEGKWSNKYTYMILLMSTVLVCVFQRKIEYNWKLERLRRLLYAVQYLGREPHTAFFAQRGGELGQ